MDKLFTREEAERLLPDLVPLLEQLRLLQRDLERHQRELAQLQWRARGNGHDTGNGPMKTKQSQCEELQSRIQQELQKIRGYGVEVKDIEMGLIDFPAQRDGKVVYLCWKLGEQGIHFWHDLDTGYPGRQPL